MMKNPLVGDRIRFQPTNIIKEQIYQSGFISPLLLDLIRFHIRSDRVNRMAAIYDAVLHIRSDRANRMAVIYDAVLQCLPGKLVIFIIIIFSMWNLSSIED
jgi:hypothetical protein